MDGKDSFGDGCGWYDANPEGCGMYDHAQFYANLECCACGGGYPEELETPLSEDLKMLPDGEKIKKVYDTITSWVKDYEAIEEKAEPAAARRERNLMDAVEDRHDEVVKVIMDADSAHQRKE